MLFWTYRPTVSCSWGPWELGAVPRVVLRFKNPFSRPSMNSPLRPPTVPEEPVETVAATATADDRNPAGHPFDYIAMISRVWYILVYKVMQAIINCRIQPQVSSGSLAVLRRSPSYVA